MPDNNEDFYFDENGLMVFTSLYLLKRGYCCGNGCRHCPYKANRLDDNTLGSNPAEP